jgi:hypothetical protein
MVNLAEDLSSGRANNPIPPFVDRPSVTVPFHDGLLSGIFQPVGFGGVEFDVRLILTEDRLRVNRFDRTFSHASRAINADIG